jgi:hypothetical protein
MGYLVPGWELTEEKKANFRTNVWNALKKLSIDRGLAKPLKIRKIEPGDLGLEDWKGKPSWIRQTTAANQVIGIYKLAALSLDPRAQHINFRLGVTGATTLFTADLSEMYAGLNIVKALWLDDLNVLKVTEKLLDTKSTVENFMANKDLRCEAYLTEPIVYSPNEHIWIDTLPPNEDILVIVGLVAEPMGVNVL